MAYTVEIERDAQKQLAKINNPLAAAIKQKLLSLENDPRPPGCKKLVGLDGWRIRIGDYRIIYIIEDNILRVLVIDIDHRKQIYK